MGVRPREIVSTCIIYKDMDTDTELKALVLWAVWGQFIFR